MGADSQPDHEHFVQFYDNDTQLVSEVGRAMCIALDQGHAVICVATPAHQIQFEKQLVARGIDADAARDSGRYVSRDAFETLSQITVSGRPELLRFNEVVGALIDRLAARYPRVWIFGEMVALMCAEGNRAGALELERIWSACAKGQPICLHCAYPAEAFSSEDVEAFVEICAEHCRVLHSDSSLALTAGQERPARRKPLVARPLAIRIGLDDRAGSKQHV